MSGVAVEKLNSGFLMRPYSLFHAGAHPTRTETMLGGWIYSMTRKDGQACRFGYSNFREKFGISCSTVARTVRKLCGAGVIGRKRVGGQKSTYTYLAAAPSSAHVRTELWFYTTTFEIFGVQRYLTNAEIDVLSLIYTHTRSKSSKNHFEGSAAEMAGILNIAKKTVARALTALLNAGLVFRSTRGLNAHKKSIFVANMKILRRLDKEEKKKEKAQAQEQAKLPPDVVNANAKADFERFYAQRRQRAFSLQDSFVTQAKKDARFVELDRAINRMELELAKAEVYAPSTLPALQASQASMRAERAQILDRLGIEEWQLEPHFTCKLCEDTGYRISDGKQCSCYKC